MHNEPTPFEQYEADQARAFNYDDEALEWRDYSPDNFIPRNNGTKSGLDALRQSLHRGRYLC